MLAYAASYFARGFLAGPPPFRLYGGLVLMEATLALPVRAGRGGRDRRGPVGGGARHGRGADRVARRGAAGARAPARPARGADGRARPGQLDAAARDEPSAREPEFTLARGTGFAAAVLLVMLCEQTFLNAGPLLVKATDGRRGGAALAGFAFNVLLIARAPLQLFQAVQTSILPHLTRLRAGGETRPVPRAA